MGSQWWGHSEQYVHATLQKLLEHLPENLTCVQGQGEAIEYAPMPFHFPPPPTPPPPPQHHHHNVVFKSIHASGHILNDYIFTFECLLFSNFLPSKPHAHYDDCGEQYQAQHSYQDPAHNCPHSSAPSIFSSACFSYYVATCKYQGFFSFLLAP